MRVGTKISRNIENKTDLESCPQILKIRFSPRGRNATAGLAFYLFSISENVIFRKTFKPKHTALRRQVPMKHIYLNFTQCSGYKKIHYRTGSLDLLSKILELNPLVVKILASLNRFTGPAVFFANFLTSTNFC